MIPHAAAKNVARLAVFRAARAHCRRASVEIRKWPRTCRWPGRPVAETLRTTRGVNCHADSPSHPVSQYAPLLVFRVLRFAFQLSDPPLERGKPSSLFSSEPLSVLWFGDVMFLRPVAIFFLLVGTIVSGSFSGWRLLRDLSPSQVHSPFSVSSFLLRLHSRTPSTSRAGLSMDRRTHQTSSSNQSPGTER